MRFYCGGAVGRGSAFRRCGKEVLELVTFDAGADDASPGGRVCGKKLGHKRWIVDGGLAGD